MPLSAEPGNGECMHPAHAKLGGNPFDLLEGMLALHRGDHSTWREQVLHERDDFGDVRHSAGNDAIELFRGPPRLHALAHHARILQSELGNCLPEKSAFLVVAVQQVHLNVGHRDSDGDAWKSSPAADIEKPLAC